MKMWFVSWQSERDLFASSALQKIIVSPGPTRRAMLHRSIVFDFQIPSYT